MTLTERPEPPAAINDVVVEVHASGYVPTELEWPSTWTDRADRDRSPSIPGHELTGVVTALDYGANEFIDLASDSLEDIGHVDLVFDVIGGDIQKRSAALIKTGGTLVTVVGPPESSSGCGTGDCGRTSVPS